MDLSYTIIAVAASSCALRNSTSEAVAHNNLGVLHTIQAGYKRAGSELEKVVGIHDKQKNSEQANKIGLAFTLLPKE